MKFPGFCRERGAHNETSFSEWTRKLFTRPIRCLFIRSEMGALSSTASTASAGDEKNYETIIILFEGELYAYGHTNSSKRPMMAINGGDIVTAG